MLSLLATLAGFASSFAPRLLDFFQDKQDKKHELAVIDQQRETSKITHGYNMEAAALSGEVAFAIANQKAAAAEPSGGRLIDALRASVRPIVTYIFVIEFCILQIVIFNASIATGYSVLDAAKIVLGAEFIAGFWGILGFWFGNRSFGGKR